MKLVQEKRAQGSIEYLLIIAGAILVALVIGAALKAVANTLGNRGVEATQGATQG